MPRYNQIQRPDLITRLQSALGIRQLRVTPQLFDEIVPVVIVGDLEKLKGVGAKLPGGAPAFPMQCAGHVTRVAVAAQLSLIMLRNPPGSRRVLRNVFVQAQASATALIRMQIMVNTAALATVVAATAVDTRFKFSGGPLPLVPPVGELSHGTQVVDPTALDGRMFYELDMTFSPLAVQQFIPAQGLNVVLDEGDGLLVFDTTVNHGLKGEFWWTEEAKAD